jgi:hypothetical protein
MKKISIENGIHSSEPPTPPPPLLIDDLVLRKEDLCGKDNASLYGGNVYAKDTVHSLDDIFNFEKNILFGRETTL